jgi:hypothetical protein
MSTTRPPQSTHDRNARYEPLRAEPFAPGMVIVKNLSRDSEHIVDLRGMVCDCQGFMYHETCYHEQFMRLVTAGELCAKCGYSHCTPSCVNRSDSR